MATPTTTAAYLLLFVGVAAVFVIVNLTVGRLLRPDRPTPEKGEIYECGEPVIGSSFVQFDIRFYVVALLFIVFDVEVAFFFPWAIVFGSATQIAAASQSATAAAAVPERLAQLGLPTADAPTGVALVELAGSAQTLAWACFVEIGVFFTLLLIGFAYVWSRGDLDWVRTTVNAAPTAGTGAAAPPRAA